MTAWNPWTGCLGVDAGCESCRHEESTCFLSPGFCDVTTTGEMAVPLWQRPDGSYWVQAENYVHVCTGSDFFLREADRFRAQAWAVIQQRADLDFYITTKRPERFRSKLPADWGNGWQNVTLCVRCCDQPTAEKHIPVLLLLPVCHREVVFEPLLGSVDISVYLHSGMIERVCCAGDSGEPERVCRFAWVKSLAEQCREAGVPFQFLHTGTLLEKGGREYRIPQELQHEQAEKAGLGTW